MKKVKTKKKVKMSNPKTVGMNYCEICHEWVENPMAVCRYEGRYGLLTIVNEGWPDRKPTKQSVHHLALAIKTLRHYASFMGGKLAKKTLEEIEGKFHD